MYCKLQSTEASNRIEGIITTDDRLKKIVREKTMLKQETKKSLPDIEMCLIQFIVIMNIFHHVRRLFFSCIGIYTNSQGSRLEAVSKTQTMLLQRSCQTEPDELDLNQFRHGRLQMQWITFGLHLSKHLMIRTLIHCLFSIFCVYTRLMMATEDVVRIVTFSFSRCSHWVFLR